MSTSNVLVIYTGGTIGMQESEGGYTPSRNRLASILETHSRFHDPSQPSLTLPKTRSGARIHYTVVELSEPKDSAFMNMADWVEIVQCIAQYHDDYDGFVVLHGTDTMAYTAAALSFMLEGLRKSVVLTGSQIPLTHSRNDAVDNLLGALYIAGQFQIPEVSLFFGNRLYRGNRCQKVDASGLHAFRSGNTPALARMGVEVEVRWDLVRPPTRKSLRVHTSLSSDVAAIRLFPGITGRILSNFVEAPLKGLVIESYGAGNGPTDRPELMEPLRRAHERGVVLVNTTQCHAGSVSTAYASGRHFAEIGVVGCSDMNPESALAKLSFLLGQGLSPERVREFMPQNLRGELTSRARTPRFSWRG